jgi:hypothetical protein
MGGSAGVNVRQLLRMLDMDAKCLDDGRTDVEAGRRRVGVTFFRSSLLRN